MFIEPNRSATKRGWIEVICGAMFSGKTEELIRRLNRVRIANQRAEIFKPAMDTRYDEHYIVSHDATRIQSMSVDSSDNMLSMVSDVDVVAIDEAQFFDQGLPEVAEQLAARGIRVIIAGLDMDFQGNPFGPIPALMAKAEYITKLHAICMKCGETANFSYRNAKTDDRILLGEKDAYEPRCRACFYNT